LTKIEVSKEAEILKIFERREAKKNKQFMMMKFIISR